MTIQPVSLEQIHLRDVNPIDGLGLFIKATFEGHHVVTGTRSGSVAARARKITSGDEVVAVNGKAVVNGYSVVLYVCAKQKLFLVNSYTKVPSEIYFFSESVVANN